MKITAKSKVLYLIGVCCIIFLLWLGNEGDNPLAYLGSELQYSFGVLDSNNALVIRDSVARSGIVASTPQIVVNRGTYQNQSVHCLAALWSALLWFLHPLCLPDRKK